MLMVNYLALAFLFLLELSALSAFSYWGFHIGNGLWTKVILGIGTPILVAVFWGTFVAPKAIYPVPISFRIFLQILVFSFAAGALHYTGKSTIGASLLGAFLVTIAIVHFTEP